MRRTCMVAPRLCRVPAWLALLAEARDALDRLRRLGIVRRAMRHDGGEGRRGERRGGLLEGSNRGGPSMQELVGDPRHRVVEACGIADFVHEPEAQGIHGLDPFT